MDTNLKQELLTLRKELVQIIKTQEQIVISQEATRVDLHKLLEGGDFGNHVKNEPNAIVPQSTSSPPTSRQPTKSKATRPNGETLPNGGALEGLPSANTMSPSISMAVHREVEAEAYAPKKVHMDERRANKLRRVLELSGNDFDQTIRSREDHVGKNRQEQFVELVQRFLKVRMYVDVTFDASMLLVIIANAIFLGLDADLNKGERGWWIANVCFGVIFWSELGLKLKMYGFRDLFWGDTWFTNIFDAALVVADTIQLAFESNDVKTVEVEPSLFRLLKFFRLTRLLRFLRWEGFSNLLQMVQGVIAGMGTLFWAVVLFFMMLYTMALLARAVWKERSDDVSVYFNSVPRAVFTVFRCTFGDCSTKDGTPIIENINGPFTWLIHTVYFFFCFFIVLGLFNIVGAIFVDSTMSYAAKLERKALQDRLHNEHLFAVNCATVISSCLEQSEHSESTCLLNMESFEKVRNLEIRRDVFQRAVANPDVERALKNLDIDPCDHNKLEDILDPDQDGHVQMLDLVAGLHRLRGQPRRSDVVSVDLMVRSLQKACHKISTEVQLNTEILQRIEHLQWGPTTVKFTRPTTVKDTTKL